MRVNVIPRTKDWAYVEAMLTDHLTACLGRRGYIMIDPPPLVPDPGAPNPPSRGPLGWLRRRRRRRSAVQVRPWAQFIRDGVNLVGRCSGPVDPTRPPDTGYPWDEGQQRRILELGWNVPDVLDDHNTYRWYAPAPDGSDGRRRLIPLDGDPVPPATAADAARLVVVTLRDIYGLQRPAFLRLYVGRSPDS